MEPKFNTSFIPKKPIVADSGIISRAPEAKNIFTTIATAVFILTLFATGAVFLYKNILIRQVSDADKALNDARSAFETDKIQSLLDLNARILAAKNLLEKHVVSSEVLGLLQSLTVKRMRFSSLGYKNSDGSPVLTLKGEVQTYNALAEQSRIFSQSEFIKDQKFSDFSLGENGNIGVSFFGILDPKLTSYKEVVQSLSLVNPNP
jgi:hypothetical protein